MPLSPAPPRQSVHDRQVRCQGYRRADGLWDIEGHLTDTKTYDFTNQHRGEVKAGEAVHEMWLRLTIDDDFVIRAVEAVTDFAPYRVCPAITPNFQRLVGVQIAPGFRRQVARHLGGVQGCTHLVELLGPLATTAFQTIWPYRRHQKESAPGSESTGFLDSCHALRRDGETVKAHWPQYHTAD